MAELIDPDNPQRTFVAGDMLVDQDKDTWYRWTDADLWTMDTRGGIEGAVPLAQIGYNPLHYTGNLRELVKYLGAPKVEEAEVAEAVESIKSSLATRHASHDASRTRHHASTRDA